MTTKTKVKPTTRKPVAKKAEPKQVATNGTNGLKPKKNWTMAELLKLPPDEIAFLAWQESYNNRLKQQRQD